MKIKAQIDVAIRAAKLVAVGYCSGLITPRWVNIDASFHDQVLTLLSGVAPTFPALAGIAVLVTIIFNATVDKEHFCRRVGQIPKLRWVAVPLVVVALIIAQYSVPAAGGSLIGVAIAFLLAVFGIVLCHSPWQVPVETTGDAR